MTKTFLKGALVATVAIAATPALANPANFNANATIVKPLVVTKVTDLNFGSTTMNPTLSSETVSVAAASGSVAVCGSVQLTCSGGGEASFTVAGVGTQTVGLSYGTPPTTLSDGGTGTVAFALNAPASVALTDGAGTFYVGGTITVVAATKPGSYTAPLTVTANYQ